MGKQKQQVISRFFAPKSKNQDSATSSSAAAPSSPSSSQSPGHFSTLPIPKPQTPPPKICATVAFSPAKRLRTSQIISSSSPENRPSKVPRLSPPPHQTDSSAPSFSDHASQSLVDKPSKTPKLSVHTHNPIPPLPNPTLHDKFLKKLLEPSQDLLEPSKNHQKVTPKYTPLEEQVVELKDKYPDVLLMVEVGYRYRFFGEDAENAARVLGIYAYMDHNFLTASVPTFRLNIHVRRLVNAGYKVGVVKQTETAAIKAHGSNKMGPFCRGLSALYTKATLEAAEDLGGAEEGCVSCNNYLVCVVERSFENAGGEIDSGDDTKIGIVGVEISNGDVIYGEFSDNFMRAKLEAMILSLSPAELLLGRPLSRQTEKLLLAYAGPASNVRLEQASRDCFTDGGALAEVISMFESMNEIKLPDVDQGEDTDQISQGNNCSAVERIMAMPDLALQALALTIRHMQQFGFERIICLGASFRPFSNNMEMTLSANALQQLEVLKNNADGSECGSLLHCMNHTLTVFGSRLLRHWVTHPLCDRNLIDARLDAVSEIIKSMSSSVTSYNDIDWETSDIRIMQPEIHYILSSVLTVLSRSADIQRGITRIFHRTATVTEFVAVIQAILLAGKQLQQLHIDKEETASVQQRTVHSSLLRKLILTASSSSVIKTAAKLLSVLNKEAAEKRDLHNLFIISDGRFPEVAKAKAAVQLVNEKLDSLITIFRQQLQICDLEFISVSGITHLIEVPLNVKVPSTWVKVNSTKKNIRYHPPEVLHALDQLSLANEEFTLVCRAAWDRFLKAFGGFYAEFRAAVQALAALDCLHSLATLSRQKNYVRPDFVSDDEPAQIQISSGRHPVLESILQDSFVPNDTYLHAEREYCQIVTGPNMGGKSCYIRQVALIAIMGQVGSFVPASSAKLHVIDSIHTRMGASDNIQLGRSTFLEELSEASCILQNCTGRSLVIVDELGRGTSTYDGMAIAYATLQYLLEYKRCMVLFVTHYPEIVDIKNKFPGSVGPYHVSYIISEKVGLVSSSSKTQLDSVNHNDITYLYKLVPGVSERSFGFKVAQLAQLPPSCIQRAIAMATKLEAAICNGEEVRLVLRHRGDKMLKPNDKVEEDEEEVKAESVEFLHARSIGSWQRFSNGCRELFSKLKAISVESDVEDKGMQCLKHAKSLAVELVNI